MDRRAERATCPILTAVTHAISHTSCIWLEQPNATPYNVLLLALCFDVVASVTTVYNKSFVPLLLDVTSCPLHLMNTHAAVIHMKRGQVWKDW